MPVCYLQILFLSTLKNLIEYFMEQFTDECVMYVVWHPLTLITFQSHFSTLRGYNFVIKTALIDIDRKEVFNVHSDRLRFFALVPRPRCDSAVLRQWLAGIDHTDGDLCSPNTARQQGL